MIDTQILNLYSKNLTQVEISKTLLVSTTQVRKVLKKYGQDMQKNKKINSIIRSYIVLFIQQGFLPDNIARILDVSKYTVRDVLRSEKLYQDAIKSRKELIKNQVLSLYSEGYSRIYIAKKLHIQVCIVSKYLIETNVIISRTESENKAIFLWKAGYSIADISNYLRISRNKIKNLVMNYDQNKIKLKERTDLINRSNRKIIRLYKSGNSIENIAIDLDLSEYEIKHIINNKHPRSCS